MCVCVCWEGGGDTVCVMGEAGEREGCTCQWSEKICSGFSRLVLLVLGLSGICRMCSIICHRGREKLKERHTFHSSRHLLLISACLASCNVLPHQLALRDTHTQASPPHLFLTKYWIFWRCSIWFNPKLMGGMSSGYYMYIQLWRHCTCR